MKCAELVVFSALLGTANWQVQEDVVSSFLTKHGNGTPSIDLIVPHSQIQSKKIYIIEGINWSTAPERGQ